MDAAHFALMIPIFALLIPITAIVLGIGSGIIKSILESQERRLEIRLQTQQGNNDEVLRQVQSLRAEVAALRDTSTQFDLSLENTLHHLADRVSYLESKSQSPISPVAESPVQRVGVR